MPRRVTTLMGLDVGERRIGVSVGDAETGRVCGLATIRRSAPERDGATLQRLIEERGATELVVGLPLNLDGTEGPQAAATRRWAAQIQPFLELPVSWRDERHTSVNAEVRLGRVGRGRSGGPPSPAARNAYRARIDREAAVAILLAEIDARAAVRADQ
jgi:putative Holliday junction resolvase